MKKFLVIVAASILTACAYAQEGYQAVGVNLDIAPCIESGASVTNAGIGVKYQYGLTEKIRLEADLDYLFKSKDIGQFDIIGNVQYVLNIAPKINVYPMVGIGYASVSLNGAYGFFDENGNDISSEYGYESEKFSTSINRFLFNIGAGAEYQITSNLKGLVEVKYQYCKDFCKLPISIGVAYNF